MSRELPLLTTLAKWPRGFGALEGFVATTYEFDRAFFDDEWLPTILEIPTSRRGAGSWFAEVETRLAHLDAAAVLVDAQAFAQGEAADDAKVNVLRPFSPRVGCYPMVAPGGKLHGKLVVLRFRQGLRMLVGSANLTRSGYRENREIAAILDWGRQKSSARLSVAARVLDGLAELANAQRGVASEVREEITRCRKVLARLRDGTPGRGIDVSPAWTGLSSSNLAVPDAVFDVWSNSAAPYTIEICSPFWDRNPHASGLSHLRQAWQRRFGSSGPAEVLLLTEAEEAGAKLKPVFPPALLDELRHPFWQAAKLVPIRPLAQGAQVDDSTNPECRPQSDSLRTRTLHAKAIRFKNAKQEVLYVGSANCTRRGLGTTGRGNAELGLIFSARDLGSCDPLRALPRGKPVAVGSLGCEDVTAIPEPPAAGAWPVFIAAVTLAYRDTEDTDPGLLKIDHTAADAPRYVLGAPGQAWRHSHSGGPVARTVEVVLPSEVGRGLLRAGAVEVRWEEQRAFFPLNLDAQQRDRAPLWRGQPPTEGELLALLSGQLDWERLESMRGRPGEPGKQKTTQPPLPSSSHIVAYEVREYCESIPRIRSRLNDELRAQPTAGLIRYWLNGPASLRALGQEVYRSRGRRGTTATAFLLSELAALASALASPADEELAEGFASERKALVDDLSNHLENIIEASPLSEDRAWLQYRRGIQQYIKRHPTGRT